MKCPYCRTENPEDAERCSRCDSRMEPIPAPAPPVARTVPAGPLPMVESTWRTVDIPSYLFQSILVTLFCCMPLGILAIIPAARVSGYVSSGNYTAAHIASDKARKWCWISFGLTVLPAMWVFLVKLMHIRGSGHCMPG